MVSLWPWRSDDNSPASFERTLSALSTKISKSQQLLDQLRQRSRRFKALWTLYTSFAYILCVIILALVVGWSNWGPSEYSALAGSPLLIYLVRSGITIYYTYRTNVVTNRLEEQQAERTKTIDKLKAATKYNSTQELLEKYGGSLPKPSPKSKGQTGLNEKPRKTQKQPRRATIGPPPTANIPQNQPMPLLTSTPQPISPYAGMRGPPPSAPSSPYLNSRMGPPEFAPNAFNSVPQYDRSSEADADGKWYDRILDLLLGEDETSSRNRIVLICKICRLVNGQAPPGIKHIKELGKWRCISCGAWNGETDESTEILQEMKERADTETVVRPEMSGPSDTNLDRLPIDNEQGSDEKTLDEEEYEEINQDIEPEETTQKSRGGHKRVVSSTI